MKTYLKRNKLIGLILISLFNVIGFTSCDSDESSPIPMSPQSICGKQFYEDECKMVWNDAILTDFSFEFQPVEGDTTKLLLELYAQVPDIKHTILVDVQPDEKSMRFSGGMNNGWYMLKVEGLYSETDEGSLNATKPKIEMRCDYEVMEKSLLDHPYIFRFDKNCMFPQAGGDAPVEWDGKTWNSWDFVKTVLGHISERIAREMTAIEVVFRKDATLEISIQRAGSSEFTPCMTIKYWFTEYNNYMFLEFKDAQRDLFYESCLGIPDNSYSPPMISIGDNRNLLKMIYWGGSESLSWSIANPFRYWALSMYVRAKGIEGLSDKDKEELLLFHKVLNNVDDRNHWMSWCITMNSEPVVQ